MPFPLAFWGTLIHSKIPSQVEILEDALIVIDDTGTIIHLESSISSEALTDRLKSLNLRSPPSTIHKLKRSEFLIPGLCDTHNHAPQYEQRGLGRGMHILDWLDKITFKNESLFADTEHAERVYDRCVKGFLKQGITSVAYYGSLHGPATKILADTCLRHGQRALIGKCNMDQNSPDFYIEESSQASLYATEDVIYHIHRIDPEGEIVRPVLTPRFAISCTGALLQGIGELVKKYPGIHTQTHFNEAQSEIDRTLSLFPQFADEVSLYSHFGLLNDKSILAHCCHMTPDEVSGLKRLNAGIAHCPISNCTVGGGFMAAPIRTFLDAGIDKIGLGTDSGGGFSSSILDAMRQACIVSEARVVMLGGKEEALTVDEVFFMSTISGARVLGIDHKVGNFQVGHQFDAILVRTSEGLEEEAASEGDGGSTDFGVMTPVVERDDKRTIFEKFVMSGDDRNLVKVWIKGRQVKG